MRCDAWYQMGCSKEEGSKKNAKELTKMITNFLGDCEDPQRTWDLFKEYNNDTIYLGLQSLRMGKLVENIPENYIVYKIYSDGRMKQVSIPLSLDKAKAFQEEMQRCCFVSDITFSIMQEVI